MIPPKSRHQLSLKAAAGFIERVDSFIPWPRSTECKTTQWLASDWLVWQSCTPTTLGEVVDNAVKSERILYVDPCERDNSVLWAALMFRV